MNESLQNYYHFTQPFKYCCVIALLLPKAREFSELPTPLMLISLARDATYFDSFPQEVSQRSQGKHVLFTQRGPLVLSVPWQDRFHGYLLARSTLVCFTIFSLFSSQRNRKICLLLTFRGTGNPASEEVVRGPSWKL